MDGPIKVGPLNGREIQNVIATIDHFEGKGVTDPQVIKQQLQEQLRKAAPRMRMTPEEREQARRLKRKVKKEKKYFMADGKDARDTSLECENCGTGVIREYMDSEGTLWYACVRYTEQGRRVWGCGYSTIEVKRGA